MICCCGILRLVASSYHVVPGGAKTSLHLQWPRTEGGRVTLKEVYQALVARGLADDPRGEDGISRVLAATKKEYEDLSQDAAKILGVALACCHTAADNCVNAFLQKRFDELDQERITLQNVISELKGVPEYTEAVRRGAGPEIVVGEAKHRAGRVMVDMTGGTEGPDQSIQRLAAAGVGTIVGMHMSEDHRKIAEEHHINVVLAGHYASDSLGMNLVLDELERSGVEVEVCSGLIRVSRVE